jgi:murein DD-endopeptidase MepM/ murein hydrolase activator NlpD
MAYLTAVYQNFPYGAISGDLWALFNEQYQLEFISEIEIRTRTETRTRTRTDPETGETWTETYEVEVQYEWHILNVILTSQAFSTVIYPKMDDDQYEHFMLLMHSRGNRQYVGNPFGFDVLPYVTSYFGYRVHPISGAKDYHKGLDIGLPEGTEILAGIDGTVTSAAFDGGYGNCIVIKATLKDGSVIEAKYAHCHTLLADVGQNVKTGDVIATVGNTGNSTGAHLHVEVVKNGIYLNPIYFMVTN